MQKLSLRLSLRRDPVTTFYFNTCWCATTYTDDGLATLVSYDRKCSYHRNFPTDVEAFEEVKSAHLAKAHLIKALRLAVNGSARNPRSLSEESPELSFSEPPQVTFDETPGRRRLVVDDVSISQQLRGRIRGELEKLTHREHAVVLGAEEVIARHA